MSELLRRLEERRLAHKRGMMARCAVKGGGLFALAGLLLLIGIVDLPNLPFGAALGVLGLFLCLTVIMFPLGLFLL